MSVAAAEVERVPVEGAVGDGAPDAVGVPVEVCAEEAVAVALEAAEGGAEAVPVAVPVAPDDGVAPELRVGDAEAVEKRVATALPVGVAVSRDEGEAHALPKGVVEPPPGDGEDIPEGEMGVPEGDDVGDTEGVPVREGVPEGVLNAVLEGELELEGVGEQLLGDVGDCVPLPVGAADTVGEGVPERVPESETKRVADPVGEGVREGVRDGVDKSVGEDEGEGVTLWVADGEAGGGAQPRCHPNTCTSSTRNVPLLLEAMLPQIRSVALAAQPRAGGSATLKRDNVEAGMDVLKIVVKEDPFTATSTCV